jgi:hypothetical protein
MRRALLVPLIAPALISCDSNHQATSEGITHRDSAGVSIVESSSPQWQGKPEWAVDTFPSLDLTEAGEGPKHEFFWVSDAIRLADGRIVVADAGLKEIRAYAPDGRFLWAAGDNGEGPGEFRSLSSISRFRGDSLLAFDALLGRITVLDTHGAVGRVAGSGTPGAMISELLVLEDSILVGSSDAFLRPDQMPHGWFRTESRLVRYSANDFTPLDTIATYPGAEGYGFALGVLHPPFARGSSIAALSSRIVIGTADVMEYRIRSAAGSLQRIVRVPGYDLALSAAEVDAALAASRRPDIRPEVNEALKEMPRPETRPAYQELITDATGHVWAKEYRSQDVAGTPLEWQIFSPDGAWLGEIQTPPRFAVLEIGEDYILGRRLDDLDVQRVQLLHLDRKAP